MGIPLARVDSLALSSGAPVYKEVFAHILVSLIQREEKLRSIIAVD